MRCDVHRSRVSRRYSSAADGHSECLYRAPSKSGFLSRSVDRPQPHLSLVLYTPAAVARPWPEAAPLEPIQTPVPVVSYSSAVWGAANGSSSSGKSTNGNGARDSE